LIRNNSSHVSKEQRPLLEKSVVIQRGPMGITETIKNISRAKEGDKRQGQASDTKREPAALKEVLSSTEEVEGQSRRDFSEFVRSLPEEHPL
jgi:hypothetical protein